MYIAKPLSIGTIIGDCQIHHGFRPLNHRLVSLRRTNLHQTSLYWCQSLNRLRMFRDCYRSCLGSQTSDAVSAADSRYMYCGRCVYHC